VISEEFKGWEPKYNWMTYIKFVYQ